MLADLRANRVLLFAGIATFVVMGAGQSLYGPALPVLSRDFSVGLGEAGLLISAHWIGCAFGVGLMFLASHRVAPRDSAVGMLIGATLIAVGVGWVVTLIGGFAIGVGYGTATVMFNRRFLIEFGDKGPAMVSLVNALFGVGAISAPLVFVALGSHVGVSYALVAAFALMTVIMALRLPPAATEAVGSMARFRLHFGILALGMAAIATEATLIGLGPVALIALGQTEVQSAKLLSAFFVSFLLIRLVLAAFSNIIAALNLLIAALLASAICCLITLFVSPMIGFVALGACAGLFFPPYFVCATRLMGDDPRVTPAIIAGGLTGGIMAPLLMGLTLRSLGDEAFFWVLAGLDTAAAALAIVFASRLRPAMAVAK
jgi:MFS transporter, FHS family, glucose/mannose:H+ symporter